MTAHDTPRHDCLCDKRIEYYRNLRERVRRRPEDFVCCRGTLHRFFKQIYEAAATAEGNADCFVKLLSEMCEAKGLQGWEDLLSPDQQRQSFKNGQDPFTRRVIAFWAELDEPLAF